MIRNMRLENALIDATIAALTMSYRLSGKTQVVDHLKRHCEFMFENNKYKHFGLEISQASRNFDVGALLVQELIYTDHELACASAIKTALFSPTVSLYTHKLLAAEFIRVVISHDVVPGLSFAVNDVIEEADWTHTGTVYEPDFEYDPWEQLMEIIRNYEPRVTKLY